MASLTRAEMIAAVLERAGVLGAGQTASAEDSAIVGRVLDSIHAQYRMREQAPFATSSWPEWAQEPYIQILQAAVNPYFGQRDESINEKLKRDGERDLVRQLRNRPRMPVIAEYF